ncbi:hypothetical protein GCM10009836_55680 [Pseudonocardia ailaonensis]|uniref:DUF4129 domain-containing protein n=1 Tax=Pseudonocardia ailaonensis TaxID=367279 RepID=A0ABN2NGD8_9PSEU
MVQAGLTERSRTGLPTLLRSGEEYRVYDPALLGTDHVLTGAGEVRHRRPVSRAALAQAAVGAGDAAGAAVPGLPWATAVGGALVAAVAAGRVLARTDAAARYSRTSDRAPFVDVAAPRGLRLCRLAAEISATRAWRSGEVDPDRELAALLWTGLTEPAGYAAVETRLSALHGRTQDADRQAWFAILADLRAAPEPVRERA